MGAVTYIVSEQGYTVTVTDNHGNVVHEYEAGNHPLESSAADCDCCDSDALADDESGLWGDY